MRVTDLEMQHILPSESDQEELYSDLAPLVYREIVKYMLSYALFKTGVQNHIPRPHSKDMSKKSEQVLFMLCMTVKFLWLVIRQWTLVMFPL